MKRSLYTVATFVRINTKRFFRDKLAIFFTIGFPLIFLFVFGGINSGSGDVSFKVAVINQSNSSFAKEFVKNSNDSKILKVDDKVTTIDQAKDKMSRSELDAAIVLPKNFGDVQPGVTYPSGQAQVVYTQNNQQSAQALSAVLEGQFKAVNAQFVTNKTPFSVTSKQLNERSLSAFDYTFAGLLGFAIIGMGIFGPVNVFPELKKWVFYGAFQRRHLRCGSISWQRWLARRLSAYLVLLLCSLSLLWSSIFR